MSYLSRIANWQFSLRGLLVAVTILAIVVAFAGYGLWSALLGFVLRGLLPTVAVVCAVYARGDIRAFSIGATIALIPLLVGEGSSMPFSRIVGTTISQLLATGLCGAVAVATRRWLVSHGLADEN